MQKNRSIFINTAIAVASLVLFVPFLGGVHLFDWDEINFAESAREMIVTGDYLTVRINFLPFWEKPPLFIWLQVLSMKVFGINEFAARFPNAICGTVTLPVLFNAGRKLYNNKFGLLWVMTYACSILPFLYFKSGIIDPWFNLFIFLGIHHFIKHTRQKAVISILMSAAFIGLAILTKGPVALLVFLLTAGIYWALNRFRTILSIRDTFIFIIVLLLTGGSWFILQILDGNFSVLKDFIAYQIRLFQTEDAGHGGFFLYHFIVLLIGVFPASVPAFMGFLAFRDDTPVQRNYKKWMLILFWIVLILFSIVKTKIVHYSSLCYFPLTFLSALVIFKYIDRKIFLPGWIVAGLIIVGSIVSAIVIVFPFLGYFKHQIAGSSLITDDFARNIVLADVRWHGYEPVAGLILIAGLILFLVFHKKRLSFQAMVTLFASSGLSVMLTLIMYTTRIEAYSQGAAIAFFKDLSDKDAYVETLGYKSYAHLFYTEKKMPENPLSYKKNWLLTGSIDKNAYFTCKITSRDRILRNYPGLKILYEKNGYVFLLREK
ncbi:MAG: glycosyltransferase family 39 protein [Bacteroidales bacterium]|nr:glycosyltransferase family 39 protein [Bacteroidales bacterium]